MNLKSLIHRELGEGMTEKELASAVRVPLRTIINILSGKDPKDPDIWEQFARYFRMDVDFLRTGERRAQERWLNSQGAPSIRRRVTSGSSPCCIGSIWARSSHAKPFLGSSRLKH